MRRLISSILLVLISFALISPLLAEKTESKIPACCLRNGRHHCTMGSQSSRSGGPAFREDCQFRNHSSSVAPGSASWLGIPATIADSLRVEGARLSTLSSQFHDTRLFAIHGERGPPSHLE